MFHNIPKPMQERMALLEEQDRRDRSDGTPKSNRLRQIPPETGRFLALLAAGAPAGQVLELGSSGGYSGLWLSLACLERGDRLVTIELDENKVRLAQETFNAAGVPDRVEVVQGDAAQLATGYQPTAFCFTDLEKELYPVCYAAVIPNLAPGGFFVADNVLSHQDQLQPFVDEVLADERVDTLVAPIGKGLLVCRKRSN